MKVVVYEDGSSAMYFTQQEAQLHINILKTIRYKDPTSRMWQCQWLVELEMAKLGIPPTSTRH